MAAEFAAQFIQRLTRLDALGFGLPAQRRQSNLIQPRAGDAPRIDEWPQ
jgi:hypothetical protein